MYIFGIVDNDFVMDEQYYYGEDLLVFLFFFIENYLLQGGQFYDVDENFYDFELGIDYEYSNIGSVLIGVLVEEILGFDFNDYCKVVIFSFLELLYIFWWLDEILGWIVIFYDDIGGQNEFIVYYINVDYFNGGFWIIVRDFYKIVVVFVSDGQFMGVSLLKFVIV